ncbi:glycoside hydrolase family 3 C-terminal domain-containing protein [Cyanobacteria bacterium FACHB-DQ100]|nr:glycoside hydrolase family 3 C-terminal domain-containing protein [Cyanobacteria bacterium FACHB-DQ100]
MMSQLETLLESMTLEEKAALTVGQDLWTTVPIERLNISPIWLSDGPTGLRKSPSSTEVGIGSSLPATAFPTESAIASSWNPALAYEVGKAIAIEAQTHDVQVLLGPGANLKRSPLGGRNFEYFSEDPVLSGLMAAATINGVQEQGIGTSLKHFVANEQETGRMYSNSLIDERTLREVYLTPFEIAITHANPWSVMAAYNQVNGTYAPENSYLLQDILRKEWGYKGIVISDWCAVNDRVASIKAGLHLQMPGGGSSVGAIVAAVKAGQLPEEQLNEIVSELLEAILKVNTARKSAMTFDSEEHHALARRAAGESIVLLKNDRNLLPLAGEVLSSVALIGRFAKSPRYQGSGSSQVVPTKVENAHDELIRLIGSREAIAYADGYTEDQQSDSVLLREAQAVAKAAKVAVVFVGLPPSFESEGYDREHIDLPQAHNELIEAVCDVQPNVAIVLTNGATVTMPWVSRVSAIIEGWLGGQAGGAAVADVLLGQVNPSGKLSETFPIKLADTPSYLSFPGQGRQAIYTEGLFIGYRWYDARDIEPLFPFGHGLSYTTFSYSELEVNQPTFKDTDTLTVSLKVKNTGLRAGQEVLQLYVHPKQPRLCRPYKELKAFEKVLLQPGEEKKVELQLSPRAFAYYDPDVKAWVTDSGEFDILIGASSRDIRLQITVALTSTRSRPHQYDRLTSLGEWMSTPATRQMLQPIHDRLFVRAKMSKDAAAADSMRRFYEDMPIAKLVVMGLLTEQQLQQMLEEVNQG